MRKTFHGRSNIWRHFRRISGGVLHGYADDAKLADSEMQWELVILWTSEELRVHSKRGH